MSSHAQAVPDEADFENQMKSLAEEARNFLGDDLGERRNRSSMTEFLRPLMQHMNALNRVMTENTMAIARLEEAMSPHAGLPRLIAGIHEGIDGKDRLNQKLFDTLHEELKGYKDCFLLEVFHRPIARDLVTLFDDLSELHRQTETIVADEEQNTGATAARTADSAAMLPKVKTISLNLHHLVHAVLEILSRMEIHRLEASSGKLDKQRQRVVSVEPADSPEKDQEISSTVKPGFLWRERTFRPEEVVIKKWRGHCGHNPGSTSGTPVR